MTDEPMPDLDEQDRRIASVLGEDDVVEVNATTLWIYSVFNIYWLLCLSIYNYFIMSNHTP